MKVLSLIEPWGTLIKEGKKGIETRSWKTSYRGELYIHASSKKIKRSDEHTRELLQLIPNVPMGYGHILCKCKLVDCIYMDQEFLNKIQENKPLGNIRIMVRGFRRMKRHSKTELELFMNSETIKK